MNTILLIFFALPIATIIVSIALQRLLKCPLLVAAIIFAIFLIVTFIINNLNFLVAAIIFAIISFITALIVCIICRFFNRNDRDDSCFRCRCRDDRDDSCCRCGQRDDIDDSRCRCGRREDRDDSCCRCGRRDDRDNSCRRCNGREQNELLTINSSLQNNGNGELLTISSSDYNGKEND